MVSLFFVQDLFCNNWKRPYWGWNILLPKQRTLPICGQPLKFLPLFRCSNESLVYQVKFDVAWTAYIRTQAFSWNVSPTFCVDCCTTWICKHSYDWALKGLVIPLYSFSCIYMPCTVATLHPAYIAIFYLEFSCNISGNIWNILSHSYGYRLLATLSQS